MNESNLRKIWFITRPERDPSFHEEALKALFKSTNNFTIKWAGNRQAHKDYEQALIDIGIKRNSISDSGSGGRTWASLLKTFSYCYTDTNGFLIPTKVSNEILNGNNIFENIKKQILTLQIPNSYFLEKGFKPKYDSNFAILPVRFLIKLCINSQLSYHLTKEEITFIVMTAQRETDLENIVSKVQSFRNMSTEDKNDYKTMVSSEYEHRERSDKGSRDFYAAHSDVAHTFMLIAEYTGLVQYDRGINAKISVPLYNLSSVISDLEYYDTRYPFNNRYLFSLERMAEVNGLDINSYKASRYGDIKPATNSYKKLKKAEKLLNQYPNPSTLSNDKIIEILSSSSFSIAESKKISEYIKSNTIMETLDENFVNGVLNEPNNLEFEKKIGRILEQLGFDVLMHPKVDGERTEIDILLKYNDNLCGIIDAKNYKEKFTLSSSLASHMISEYISNYINYDNYDLKFFGYVTCSDIGGISNISKISAKSSNNEILGIMINAKTLLSLLDYCISNDIPPQNRVELFLKLIDNSSYTSFTQILDKI
ncbi:restriction endonuclease [Clostridium tarantellae]|uniref:Restriction endonuclease n=1 Tax=Clostridium tarantellae TaxID=39493 RepID=A0A6I1MKC4_9CLOT|nr:restriction endonuclease [Clostridium tarantellae]MPQ43414.1 restriction endonuclease [Clostridium tarantellae]